MATEPLPPSEMAVPPGEMISMFLEETGMVQDELAARMGQTSDAVTEIIDGRTPITAELALKLEEITEMAAHIWLGLEARYQQALAKKLRQRAG